MKIKDAIDWIDIARMGYICDPNECGLEKGGDPCKVFHCDEIHDALVMAMDTLKRQNWIPVSERTPNEEEEVLLQFSKNQCVGFWGCERWHINSGGGWYTDVFEDDEKPIAWVPLLEPYKGCDTE